MQQDKTIFETLQANLFAHYPNMNYMMFSYISPEPVFSGFECKTIVRLAHENKLEYQKINANESVDVSKFNAKTTCFEYGKNCDVDYFYHKIRELVSTMNESMWRFDLWDFGEPLKFMEYEKGGFAISHSDVSHDTASKYRKLTIVVQLSDEDEYEGGELMIQLYEREYFVPKKIGTVIIFPSFLIHRIEPVKKGVRNALVCFAYGPPFR